MTQGPNAIDVDKEPKVSADVLQEALAYAAANMPTPGTVQPENILVPTPGELQAMLSRTNARIERLETTVRNMLEHGRGGRTSGNQFS